MLAHCVYHLSAPAEPVLKDDLWLGSEVVWCVRGSVEKLRLGSRTWTQSSPSPVDLALDVVAYTGVLVEQRFRTTCESNDAARRDANCLTSLGLFWRMKIAQLRPHYPAA